MNPRIIMVALAVMTGLSACTIPHPFSRSAKRSWKHFPRKELILQQQNSVNPQFFTLEKYNSDKVTDEYLEAKYGVLSSLKNGQKWWREYNEDKPLYLYEDKDLKAVRSAFDQIDATLNESLPTALYLQDVGEGGFGKVLKYRVGDAEIAIKESHIQNADDLYYAAMRQVELSDLFSGEAGHVIYYGSWVKVEEDHTKIFSAYKLQERSLEGYLSINERLPRYDVYHLIQALETMHKNGIAHFDIKPQNILLSKQKDMGDWNLLLTDLGSASAAGRLHISWNPFTAITLSPEYLLVHKKKSQIEDEFFSLVLEIFLKKAGIQEDPENIDFEKLFEDEDLVKMYSAVTEEVHVKWAEEGRHYGREIRRFIISNNLVLDSVKNDIYALGLSLAMMTVKPSDLGSEHTDMFEYLQEEFEQKHTLAEIRSVSLKMRDTLLKRGGDSDIIVATLLDPNPPSLRSILEGLNKIGFGTARTDFYTR
ncbi:MAG: hypothetical protein OXT67_09485 [Zetaproteobacteria bacterium]|nr:hypothetical protein [Zetaproteobacteria bacterium]